MSTNLEGIQGKSVVVKRPNELRPPYNTKVVGKVGVVEFSHLSKAATLNASVAQVRFDNKGDSTSNGRAFVVPIKVSNLRVVPPDYDPLTGVSAADLARSDYGANARVVQALQRQCEAYRRECANLRKENAALKARIGSGDMYKLGNIVLWQGDGSVDIETIDAHTPVLLTAELMVDLLMRSRAAGGASTGTSASVATSGSPPVSARNTLKDDMVSLEQVAQIIVKQFEDKSDDFVTSIGNWEEDPLAPGHERFSAVLRLPLGDWRAYIRPKVKENAPLREGEVFAPALVERDMTVRFKNPESLPVRRRLKVGDREGTVLSVERPTTDPSVGTALVHFAKPVRNAKDYEERVNLADLVIVTVKRPADPQE